MKRKKRGYLHFYTFFTGTCIVKFGATVSLSETGLRGSKNNAGSYAVEGFAQQDVRFRLFPRRLANHLFHGRIIIG